MKHDLSKSNVHPEHVPPLQAELYVLHTYLPVNVSILKTDTLASVQSKACHFVDKL